MLKERTTIDEKKITQEIMRKDCLKKEEREYVRRNKAK